MNYFRSKLAWVPLLCGLLCAVGCIRAADTTLYGFDEAKNFISRQHQVTGRTGEVRNIISMDASTKGRSMPFGWGDRSEENYVLRVEGARDTVYTRVQLRRTPKSPWQITDWGILSTTDAAQYAPPTP